MTSTTATPRGFFGVLVRRPSLWFMVIGSVAALIAGSIITRSRQGSSHTEELAVLSKVPPFELTDQHGAAFGSKDLDGQVWVANFVFTRCPTICPTFTAKMAAIQKRSPEGLKLVSFTVDPEYDTPEKLDAYAKQYSASERWSFLTGERPVLTKLVVEGMMQPMDVPTDPTNLASLVHGSYFVLVDQQRRARGFYKFDEPESVEQVLKDAATLLGTDSSRTR